MRSQRRATVKFLKTVQYAPKLRFTNPLSYLTEQFLFFVFLISNNWTWDSGAGIKSGKGGGAKLESSAKTKVSGGGGEKLQEQNNHIDLYGGSGDLTKK